VNGSISSRPFSARSWNISCPAQPIMGDNGMATSAQTDSEEEFFDEKAPKTVEATIKDLLETRIRPAVAQ
jgi:hypothetical protein